MIAAPLTRKTLAAIVPANVIDKNAFVFPSKLPMLFSHDLEMPFGVWDEIVETPAGLQIKRRLLVNDVARAPEVRALGQASVVTGLSIPARLPAPVRCLRLD
jgi:phage head maturation protease